MTDWNHTILRGRLKQPRTFLSTSEWERGICSGQIQQVFVVCHLENISFQYMYMMNKREKVLKYSAKGANWRRFYSTSSTIVYSTNSSLNWGRKHVGDGRRASLSLNRWRSSKYIKNELHNEQIITRFLSPLFSLPFDSLVFASWFNMIYRRWSNLPRESRVIIGALSTTDRLDSGTADDVLDEHFKSLRFIAAADACWCH